MEQTRKRSQRRSTRGTLAHEAGVAAFDVSQYSSRFSRLWWSARACCLIAAILILPLPLLLAAYLLSGGVVGAYAENDSRDHVLLVTALFLRFLPVVIAAAAVIPGFYGRSFLLYSTAVMALCGIGAAAFIYAAVDMHSLFGPDDGYGYWYVAIVALVLLAGSAGYGSFQAGALRRELQTRDFNLASFSMEKLGKPTVGAIAKTLALPTLATVFAFNFEGVFSDEGSDQSLAGWLRLGVDRLLIDPSNWLIDAFASLPGMEKAPIGALEFVFPVMIFLAGCAALVGLWRLGARLAHIGAARMMRLDARPPILLLRSFADDPATVQSKSALFRLISRRVRIEEVLGAQFSSLGPFIAIGKPRESLPPLGAHRAYLEDDKWQEAVLRWLVGCRVIVMVVGTTRWVRWELEQVQRMSVVDKLVLVFPSDPAGWQDRWSVVSDCFAQSAWSESIAELSTPHVRALRLLPNGSVLAITSDHDTQTDYEVALQYVFGILPEVGQPAPGALRSKATSS